MSLDLARCIALLERAPAVELGVVNLEQLLATRVAHDLDHLAQIARVMAKQVGDEVGPWKRYLSILQR